MKKSSSRHRNEQVRAAPGFPLRPLVLSLALHFGVMAAWLPLLAGHALQVLPSAPLQGVLLTPTQQETVAVVATSPAVPPAPTLRKLAATAQRQESPPQPNAPPPAAEPAVSFPQASAVAGGISRESSELPNVAVVERQPTPSGPDQAGLRQFRLALAGEARKHRRYPETARRAGLTGTAEVRIAIEAGGLARHADLSRSSGHDVLDKAALEMLRMAATRAVLPESLRGQSFAVLMPVVFEVED